MGGIVSRSSVDVVNNIAVDVIQKSLSTCTSNITQEQVIRLRRVRGDVIFDGNFFTQNASLDTKCLLSSVKQAEILTGLTTAITNYAESRGILGLFGNNRSEAETNIRNQLRYSISQETVSEIIHTIRQTFHIDAVDIDGNFIFRNNNINQTAKLTAEAIVNDTQYGKNIANIGNKIQQYAGSDNSFIDTRTLMFYVFIICVAIILFCLISSSLSFGFSYLRKSR